MGKPYFCKKCEHRHLRGKIYKKHKKYKKIKKSDIPDVDISELEPFDSKEKRKEAQNLFNELQMNMIKRFGKKIMSL